MDYEKLGLKCGIEIHQQLDTKKLFCECKSSMQDKAEMEIIRKLRAVAGETGEIDAAAMHEFLKGQEFHYRTYPEESCLVEADEEPPHDMNREALDTGLTIARMLNCEIPDEIHVMRKQVIDGSNTSGFQRTAMIGLNGFLETQSGRVGITGVALEEDASQILKKEDRKVFYGLNRLGIPLVEIGTTPDIKSPEHAKEVAYMIGMILRSTGRVKRGIGTIRQDINISIRGGARIEIKGAQELRLIPKYVEHEVLRQKNLIEIKQELKKKGFTGIEPEIIEVTEIFSNSESRIVKGKKVFALKLPGFGGMLKRKLTPTRTLGNELANYVKVKTGSPGFIHSDEDLSKYKLEKEFERLRKTLKAEERDCIVIVAGEETLSRKTLECLIERVNMLVEGVPEETRRALDNGDTEYMRPLPGAARLYPETDILPIRISREKISEIDKNLPEPLEDKIKRFMEDYGLNEELAKQVVRLDMWKTFEKAVKQGVKPVQAASFLTSGLKAMKRDGIDVNRLSEERILEILILFGKGRITKETLPDAVKKALENPNKRIEEIVQELGGRISEEGLRKIVIEVIERNKNVLKRHNPEKILMGEIMKIVRGKVPGNRVIQVLREEIEKRI